MRFLLLASVSFLFSCGNGTNTTTQRTTTDSVRPKAGALDVLADSTINRFLALNEVLVKWDSSKVDPMAKGLILSLDSLKNGVPADSANLMKLLTTSQDEIRNLVKASPLEEKRKAYHRSNTAFFEFLKSNHFKGSTVYLQQCPMAFNDTAQGLWLSRTQEIRNPYLGLHHPRYGKGMLECGHNKEVLNGTLEEE